MAKHWYVLVAEQGDYKAQSALGECYNIGKGVEQNYTEAIKWYRLAAEQGEEDAKEALARLQDE